jgi:hypothetical protein
MAYLLGFGGIGFAPLIVWRIGISVLDAAGRTPGSPRG